VEQKDLFRALLATVLALSFIILWNTYVFPPAPRRAPTPPRPAEAPAPAQSAAGAEEPAAPVAQPPPSQPAPPARRAQVVRKLTVETPLYKIAFTNEGARVEDWWLKHYQGSASGPIDLVSARFRKRNQLPLGIRLKDAKLEAQINRALFEVEPATDLHLTGPGDTASLVFRYSDGRGLQAEKQLRFSADRYPVEARVKVRRNGLPIAVALLLGPELGNPKPEERGSRQFVPTRAAYLGSADGLKTVEVKKLAAKPWRINGPLVWAGLEDKYFLAAAYGWHSGALEPLAWARLEQARVPGGDPGLSVAVALPDQDAIQLFFGPKDYEILGHLPVDLRGTIEFGWFGWLAVPLLYALKFLRNYVGSYGLAIIVITILLRVVFYPLNKIQIDSSKKMSALQPKMNAIKERYRKFKGDMKKQQEMNQELQELFRKEGVNPLGGCLPMLAQFPVFIAFYNLLNSAIELRGQPFLYLRDLSAKDPTLVLPLLMGASWFLQMRMMPATPGANPAQQKMMQFMPLLFTAMFLEMPSGLILYWFVTNLLAIAQQYFLLGPGSKSPKGK
jgi:YidC/Oxa1 family membrane protein insertase